MKITKPNLSLKQIINMSVGFLGIQMGFALQNANASNILSSFGANVESLSWFWLVAPLTGLIVQPIIGYMGDNTWGFLGRRKPYFLIGAILAALGLMFLPNSTWFVSEQAGEQLLGLSLVLWFAVLFLALMDASFNISMEPFRALVGDLLPNSQSTLGFSIQTILIGLGAVIGSWLPTLLEYCGLAKEAPKNGVAPTIMWSFFIGALVLLTTIIYTIITTKEYPPEEFEKYKSPNLEQTKKAVWAEIFHSLKNLPTVMKQLGWVQFFSWFALFSMWVYTSVGFTQKNYDVAISPQDYVQIQELISKINPEQDNKKEFYEKTTAFSNLKLQDNQYYVPQALAAYFGHNTLIKETELYDFCTETLAIDNSKKAHDYINILKKNSQNFQDKTIAIPAEILQYCIQKNPEAGKYFVEIAQLKQINKAHADGGNVISSLFGWYNFWAIPFAFLLPLIAKRFTRKVTHFMALLAGGIGLLLLAFSHHPMSLFLASMGIGFAWSSILSLPYALLVNAIPINKMGIYMGIFNFFIVIPQIINGALGGKIVQYLFDSTPIYYIGLAGGFMILAGLLTLKIKEI